MPRASAGLLPMADERLSRYVLYSRRNCCLCEEMLAALREHMGADLPVEIVDVDADPALKARYGEHVPVLMDGGTELCRTRYDRAKLAAYVTKIR